MAEAYIVNSSEEGPEIKLDPESQVYSISGHSFPEDVYRVYLPVIEWINDNAGSLDHMIHLTFDLNYINSATSKILIDVFKTLENETKNTAFPAEIHWKYDEDDMDNMELGNFYKKAMDITIHIEQKK